MKESEQSQAPPAEPTSVSQIPAEALRDAWTQAPPQEVAPESMKYMDNRPANAAELRQRAEEIARENTVESSENLEALSPEEMRQTVHELHVHQIELTLQNEELRRAQVKLDAARARYFDLYDLAPVGYVTLSEQGLILQANLTAAALLGMPRGQLVQQFLSRFIVPEDADTYYLRHKQLLATDAPQAYELRMVKADGTVFWTQLVATAASDAEGEVVFRVVLTDVTARKRAERYQGLFVEILGTLNQPLDVPDSVNQILTAIQRETGFDAVGIRLRKGEDFPYFVQNGFSEEFLRTENTLLVLDQSGGACRQKKGHLGLACTCGLVLSGQTDPANALFTQSGSFWTNNMLPLLDLPADQDPRRDPRNTCIHRGYCSVALIPIRVNRDIVGLLQLNDRKKDCFTPEMVHFFEGIAAGIGVALLRKQQEDALRESETRHRLLFDGSRDALLTLAPPTWQFTSGNPAAVAMFGARDAAEFATLGPCEVSPERQPDGSLSADKARTVIEAALRAGFHFFEWTHRRPGGGDFAATVLLTKIEMAGQAFLQATVRDVTVQKRAEQALRESEARLRSITDSAQDAILMMDPEGRVSYWNPAAERILGYTSAEAIGQVLHAFIVPPRYRAAHQAAFPAFQQTGHGSAVGQTLDLAARRKDGQEIPVQLSLSAIQIHGGWHAVGLLRDVTEYKRAEAELRESEASRREQAVLLRERKQAEQELREVNYQLEAAVTRAQELAVQAEAANAAKSRFLATMSHEIRTPLNAVLGFSQLLQRDPKLALDHQQWVATINRSGTHLLALLDEILELSKIQAGQQTLVSSAFDLPALLRELVTMFRPQADAKQLTLRLDGLDDVEPYLVADAGKLRQILINLLGNAVKFTATGGVWVRASTAPLEDLAGLTVGWRLVVLVGDSGPGIGAEDFGRLFAAFEQATAGRHSCSGTGLGLAIGRQLARLMGGDLTVTSEVGQGSVFRMEVQAQPAIESMVATKLEGSQVQSGLNAVHAPASQPDGTTVAGSPALIRERLDSLPAELRTQLHEAALCGRRELLRKTLQQVADPELRKQLEKLVAKFDYAPFLELLS